MTPRFRLSAVALLALPGLFFFLPAGDTDDCRAKGMLCGKVYLTGNSDASLQIADDIPVSDQETLEPGQTSTSVYDDTDAIKAPEDCTIAMLSGLSAVNYPGGQWVKIADTAPWDVRVITVHC